MQSHTEIIQDYLSFLRNREFPCIAAKAAAGRQQVECMVAQHMECPGDDEKILQFLYAFVDTYRQSQDLYHTAAILFKQPDFISEEDFEAALWMRLQAIADRDAKFHNYDSRVNRDPSSPEFSFSIGEEAFYIIGLHPQSSRIARRFKYPTLVFNPHHQFEALRQTAKYDAMKRAVRKKDVALSGSVNPMLEDFGNASEAFQYSGRQYDPSWRCPLKLHHGKT